MHFRLSTLLTWFRGAQALMPAPAPKPPQSATSDSPAPIELLQVKSALERYLQFYVGVEEPGYAVLVTGPWGSGKTYQVQGCLPPDRTYYVSLYGVDSVEQLHAEVLAAAAPALGKIKDSAGTIADFAADALGLGQLGQLVPKVFNSVLRRQLKNDHVLVFDDLERSHIALNDLLGAINVYVEHKKFRVIVIAHDEKMLEQFATVKEKTFGQTLRVETQLASAFDTFLTRILDSGARDFIKNHEEEILRTFDESRIGSLRILRHVVEDLARFYPALTEKHFAKPNALTYLVALFVAFNVEVRAGRLSERDLRDRYGQQVKAYFRARRDPAGAEQAPMPLASADERYTRIQLTDTRLNDDVLVAMLVRGSYDSREIRESLDASPHFTKSADLRPWQVVIKFDELADDVVSAAVERMETEFADRTVVDPGELLHIFSLRMLIADESGSAQAIQNAEEETIQYIDDIAAECRLPAMESSAGIRLRNESYGGYAFWVQDTYRPQFAHVCEHLEKARTQALVASYPALAEKLMHALSTDPDQAAAMLRGEMGSWHAPFLQCLDPARFAAAWIALEHARWRSITTALDFRYGQGRLDQQYAVERDWLLRLARELEAQAESRSGFAALRIKRAVPNAVKELANEDEPA